MKDKINYYFRVRFNPIDDSKVNLPPEGYPSSLIVLDFDKETNLAEKELLFLAIKRYCNKYGIRMNSEIQKDMDFKSYGFEYEFVGRYIKI